MVKRKFFTWPSNPFVTLDVLDSQNCGKMQILDVVEQLFRHFGRVRRSKLSHNVLILDLTVVEELHNSFKRWKQQPGVCNIMAVCLAATACKAGTSWPLGHVLLLSNGTGVYACYLSAEKPKLLFFWIAIP